MTPYPRSQFYNRINVANSHLSREQFVLNRHRWVINLVVAVSLLALTGFSLFPIVNLVLDNGAVVAAEANGRSPQQNSQLQATAQGYIQVLKREPENQVALKGLLDAQLQLGDVKGSLLPLQKIAMLNPQVPDYTVLLAQTKQYLGDRDGAADSYRAVLALHPQNINALQGLVSLLLDAKLPEAAIGEVQTAIAKPSIDKDKTPLKLLLAQIYITQQRNADAIDIYDGLMTISRDDFRPILAKALVYKQMGNLSEAQALLVRAETLAPANYKDRVNKLVSEIDLPRVGVSPTEIKPTPSGAPSVAPAGKAGTPIPKAK
jgi:tetratricopeptide (TPR) repeat protein